MQPVLRTTELELEVSGPKGVSLIPGRGDRSSSFSLSQLLDTDYLVVTTLCATDLRESEQDKQI